MASTRYPVISPGLLGKGAPLKNPNDLRHYTLLHEGSCFNFEKWIGFAGASVENARRGLSFASYDQLLLAATEGQGVALGYDVIVSGDLDTRRLVRLFDVEFPLLILYSMVTPQSWSERPRIAAFGSWLMKETGALIGANSLPALCCANDVSAHARP